MKEASNIVTDELLAKYLLGEASAAEAAQVQEWLPLHSENQRHFDHFKQIWEQSQSLAARSTVNENEAWDRLQQRMLAATETKIVRLRQKRIWAAAAVLLAVIAGAWWWSYNANGYRKELALRAGNSVRTDTLPDGSVVTLNKHATLRFHNRQLQLEGEAFFNVRQDLQHPFTVIANGNTIKVLGTSFNVKANAAATEVIVESGAVSLTAGEYILQLRAGEKALVSGPQVMPVKERNADELYNYYRTRQFVCNATPLWKLAEKLEEVYNVRITIADPALRTLQLTTTFNDESLDQILAVIRKTFPGMDIQRQGDEIRIK